jgi:uncharacterized phage-associated protein
MSSYQPVDVAEDIMRSVDRRLTAKQVQKLMFYAHAIHLARTGTGLVPHGFQAWRDGPVSRSVYDRQRGDYAPSTVEGNPDQLPVEARESVRLAIELYGDKTETEIIALSHGDGPWTLARGPIDPRERSNALIEDKTIEAVLVPTVARLLEAHRGRRVSLEEFRAEFAR